MTRKMTVAGMVVLALMVPAFVPRASADGADGWPLAQWSEWRLRAVPRLELSSGIFLEEGTRPLPGHLSKSSASQLLYQRNVAKGDENAVPYIIAISRYITVQYEGRRLDIDRKPLLVQAPESKVAT